PKPRVGSFAPNLFKLTEPFANLLASRPVSSNHSFNCDGFLIALHGSLSMTRFYERLRKLVNELFIRLIYLSVVPEHGYNEPMTRLVAITTLLFVAALTAVSQEPAETTRPLYGVQGVLVETLDGKVVSSQAENEQFNPASTMKLATALMALKT